MKGAGSLAVLATFQQIPMTSVKSDKGNAPLAIKCTKHIIEVLSTTEVKQPLLRVQYNRFGCDVNEKDLPLPLPPLVNELSPLLLPPLVNELSVSYIEDNYVKTFMIENYHN